MTDDLLNLHPPLFEAARSTDNPALRCLPLKFVVPTHGIGIEAHDLARVAEANHELRRDGHGDMVGVTERNAYRGTEPVDREEDRLGPVLNVVLDPVDGSQDRPQDHHGPRGRRRD